MDTIVYREMDSGGEQAVCNLVTQAFNEFVAPGQVLLSNRAELTLAIFNAVSGSPGSLWLKSYGFRG